MGITIVRTLSEEKWRRFVEEHPAGNIFHTPEKFQRVFEQAKQGFLTSFRVTCRKSYQLCYNK
jgi:phage gp29-like protein